MWEFNHVDLPVELATQFNNLGAPVLSSQFEVGGAILEVDWLTPIDVSSASDGVELSREIEFDHPLTDLERGIYAIPLLPSEEVKILVFNSKIHTLATNFSALAPREFAVDPRSQSLVFRLSPLIMPPSLTFNQVKVFSRRITEISTTVATHLLPPLLKKLPLVGDFSWDLNLEEHPSATFRLLATYQTISTLRAAFQRGKEYEIFSIGFRVASLQETQGNLGLSAGGAYFLNVRLEGKWKYPTEKQSVYLRRQEIKAGNNNSNNSNNNFQFGGYYGNSLQAYQDSDCGTSTESPGPTTAVAQDLQQQTQAPPPPQFTSLQELGGQIGAIITGPPIAVEIPPDEQPNTPTTLSSFLEEGARVQGCFIDYSISSGIRLAKFEATRNWAIADKELFPLSEESGIKIYLTHDYRDIQPPSGGSGIFAWQPLQTGTFPAQISIEPSLTPIPENLNLIGYGLSFPPTRLEFGSNENSNKNSNVATKPEQYNYEGKGNNLFEPNPNNKKPRFKRRGRVEKTYTEGDTENLGSPPPGVDSPNLDMLWTKSGPTKTEIERTTIDGMPKRDRVSTWGYKGTARTGISWGEVKRETTEHHYDAATGYYLGSTPAGFIWQQLLQENLQSPETCKMKLDNPKLGLYDFRIIGISGATRKVLHQFRDYYLDSANSETPLFDIFKTCNRDGSSSITPIFNPNFVTGMFEISETTARSSFAFAKNPDYDPGDPEKNKLPQYFTCGEDTLNRVKRTVLPAAKNATPRLDTLASFSIHQQPNASDSYSEYRSNFSASGALFSDGAEETEVAVNQGRPPAATRLPDLYELEESPVPTNNSSNPASFSTSERSPSSPITSEPPGSRIEQIVCTPPHSLIEPISGSKSYPAATSYEEALQAFKTELKMGDVRQTLTTNLQVPLNLAMRPGDKLRVAYGQDSYNRIITSISGKITFQGLTALGELVASWEPMAVSAGIDRQIPVLEATNIIPLPKEPEDYTNRDPNEQNPNPNRPKPKPEIEIFFAVANNFTLGEDLPYTTARIATYG